MNYIPLARKYRPTNFIGLRGQEPLVLTLKNAIIYNKIANAYLLSGIRGTGKTTSARIIAKTVTCHNISEEAVPCDECKSCKAFDAHPDIIEFDAASNTGVEDIRAIIDACEYKPLIGKYKVYIIDEVHMLSKSAFNAILKVLEEPPQHVVFVFATTEVNKIPITVISRCQRFDLSRISITEISDLLENICKKEDIAYTSEALRAIAQKSDGSARDAIFLLEKLSIYDKAGATIENLDKALGNVGIEKVLNYLAAVIESQSKDALEIISEIYCKSYDLHMFFQQVVTLLVHIIKYKIGYQDLLYQQHKKHIDILSKQELSYLSIIYQILENGFASLKGSFDVLLAAEMLTIKAICIKAIPNIEKAALPVNHDKKDVYFILDLLYKSNNMKLYYYLLNEVEIINYSFGSLSIAGSAETSKEKEELKILLNKLTGTPWEINYSLKDSIESLKSKLISDIEKTSQWSALSSCFSGAKVIDILHK